MSDSSPPRQPSSVERVKAKESFEPDEPLPAFTFPAIDEEQKQELLRRVEASRAASSGEPSPLAPAEAAPGDRPLPRPPTAGAGGKALQTLRRGAGRAVDGTRRLVDAASGAIDRARPQLPERLRKPLAGVSARAILATLVTLWFGLLLGTVLLVRGRGAAPPVPAPSAAPSAALPPADPVPLAIEEAKKQGPAALEKLSAEFPKDYRVWLELAANRSARADLPGAVAAVGKALAADAKANDHAIASDVLALAVRKRATTNAAFDLLAGPMGPTGATLLYELSIDPEAPLPLRARAEGWVRSDAFKKVATTDVLLAASLRYASSCEARHDLLSAAGEKGGRRVLQFLLVAKSTQGCGRNAKKDCFPCLHKDGALDAAMSAIDKRFAGE